MKMLDERIKLLLDNTILDSNNPTRLGFISSDFNYGKLIPAIKNLILEVKVATVPEKRTDWTPVAVVKGDRVQTVADIYNTAIDDIDRRYEELGL